jgi:hypothetical protein
MVSYVCGGVRGAVFVPLPVKLLALVVGPLLVVEGSVVRTDSLVQALGRRNARCRRRTALRAIASAVASMNTPSWLGVAQNLSPKAATSRRPSVGAHYYSSSTVLFPRLGPSSSPLFTIALALPHSPRTHAHLPDLASSRRRAPTSLL